MPGKFPPPNFHQSDLGRRADSRWALPQISSFVLNNGIFTVKDKYKKYTTVYSRRNHDGS